MERSKNDKVDSRVLLEFAARMPFQLWQPPSEKALELRAVSRRISTLTDERAKEKNRLHAAKVSLTTPRSVVADIKQNIRNLNRSIAKMTEEGLRLIADDPVLARKFELLTSTKASALRILGELAALPDDLDKRQWVALAGLDPQEYKSGKSVNKKKGISKAGNKNLRQALFMPAMTARKYEPNVRAFYEKLVAHGLKPIQGIVAVMRKLLHAIWGMFKNDKPFNAQLFYQIPLHADLKTQT